MAGAGLDGPAPACHDPAMSDLPSILVATAVLVAIFFVMARVIKRHWIDHKPVSPGAQMVAEELMRTMSSDERRKAIAEIHRQSESRGDREAEGGDRDPAAGGRK
jgi:hypothetical protein